MPVIPIIAVLLSLVGLITLSARLVNKGIIKGESARKMVHVGMGVICLTFPWLFKEALPVYVLAGSAVVSILIMRVTKLRSGLGASLFSVNRLSVGELIFPIAVVWLYALNLENEKHSIIFYTIPLLLLTLADTVGAIAGTKFGKRIYSTASGKKSVEGSLAFFVTAYVCTFVPLALFTGYETYHIAILALIIALFITAVEGISGMGMDNLLIPIGCYFLLDYYTSMPTQSLWLRVICIVLLMLLMIWTRSKHDLNGGAVLTAVILCFASFMLGSIYCLAACFMIFTRHLLAIQKIPVDQKHKHSIDTMLAISLPAMTWLTLGENNLIGKHISETFFILSLAVTIALLHSGTHKFLTQGAPITKRCLVKSAGLSAIVASLCFPLLSLNSFVFIMFSTTTICGFCASIFYRLRSAGVPTLNDWIILCIITGVSTTILFYSHAHYYPNV
jgi:phytol kinase